ncbi:MAG: mevalonate kinase [Chloroflexi bacterium]|nr:mevalonate kinase [Chloroflexota bacterium]
MGIHPSHSVTVSAPGKLMLLGEHAVVHRRTCLVTAMDSRLTLRLTLAPRGDRTFTIRAPDVGVEQVQAPLTAVFAGEQAQAYGTRFIESTLAVFHEHFGLARGVRIETHSDFSSRLGLGSSSATVACTLAALAHSFAINLDPQAMFELGLQAIFRVQRTGSGFDLASTIYGGTLFYANHAPRRVVPLNAPDLPLVVAYTGVKADTTTYVNQVNARLARWSSAMHSIFEATDRLVAEGRRALEGADWPRLGELMDMQHGLAHALGVDTPETAALVFAARAAGAYGAKLSGAGGGDCIIALVPEDRRATIEAALEAAGGQIVRVAPNAPGVRIDARGSRT